MPTETTDEQYRKLATADYGSALVEIDRTATVHTFHAGSSKGAWVAAWVWIDKPHDAEEEGP